MTSLFDAIELDDRTNQSAKRKATVLANHRVESRIGGFVKAASNAEEREARLALVQDDLESIVAGACQEIGFGDPAKISTQIRARLAGEEDRNERTASVHEARRPKLCPYHSEVVDISLAQGEPQAGYTAMSQHAWGENHCKGGYEGRCNFKPAMVTQTFWDERSEQAEQRRQEREEQRQLEQQQAPETVEEVETPETPEESITEAPEGDGGEVLEFPSEERTEAPEAISEVEVPMAMAAKTADVAPLDGSQSRTAELEKLAPGNKHLEYATPKRNRQYEHILESCKKEHPDYDLDRCKELAASTVNKQRAEHGETKSHSVHASITHNSYSNPGGRVAAEAQGEHIGPIKRVKVDEGSDTPIPKIDKRKWTPDSVREVDADSEDGPHPTKRKDILDTGPYKNDPAPTEIGDQVTERQDVTKDGGPSHAGQGGTFPSGTAADAVTSAKLVDDVEKNPLQTLIEGDYDGFVPEAEIQQAIASYRR